ncbi:MAG: amidohydrolase family protein [Myxococcota bacterium]|nr:amidohydrolase family protein [Myxococcota bacterium]
MPLPEDQVLISADDHLDIHAMPPDVWSSRLPEVWRERGPHVEETEDGPYWFCDGRRMSPSGRKEKGFIAAEDHGFRPGQPTTRLEDMDRDGVRAQVVYGPSCTQMQITDAELHEQVAMVYNDWAAEFQNEAPDRLVLLPDIPPYDPQIATRELERCAELGHKGAIISSTVGRGRPIFEDEWQGFWDAAQEIGFPIHVHLAGGFHSLQMKPGSWRMPAGVAVIPMQLDETLAGMIFSGTLEKRPRVKFVMGEAGLGWLPYVIERLDHELHKYGSKIQDHKLEMLPSEIFARQVFTTYEDEQLGVELVPRIGADNVMWASDYPHGDSTWPESRRAVAESALAMHGPEVLRKVTCENAARVYGFKI